MQSMKKTPILKSSVLEKLHSCCCMNDSYIEFKLFRSIIINLKSGLELSVAHVVKQIVDDLLVLHNAVREDRLLYFLHGADIIVDQLRHRQV